jgi:hypothetical protein
MRAFATSCMKSSMVFQLRAAPFAIGPPSSFVTIVITADVDLDHSGIAEIHAADLPRATRDPPRRPNAAMPRRCRPRAVRHGVRHNGRTSSMPSEEFLNFSHPNGPPA